MAGTYTQLTRNEAGEYIRETKNAPKTFYLVEYATIATYFKVEAATYEEACDKMYDDGVESVEHPDRFDVIVDDTYDDDGDDKGSLFNMAKEKLEWREMVAKSRHGA